MNVFRFLFAMLAFLITMSQSLASPPTSTAATGAQQEIQFLLLPTDVDAVHVVIAEIQHGTLPTWIGVGYWYADTITTRAKINPKTLFGQRQGETGFAEMTEYSLASEYGVFVPNDAIGAVATKGTLSVRRTRFDEGSVTREYARGWATVEDPIYAPLSAAQTWAIQSLASGQIVPTPVLGTRPFAGWKWVIEAIDAINTVIDGGTKVIGIVVGPSEEVKREQVCIRNAERLHEVNDVQQNRTVCNPTSNEYNFECCRTRKNCLTTQLGEDIKACETLNGNHTIPESTYPACANLACI